MSLIQPTGRKGPRFGKGGGRRNNNNQIYACALPVALNSPRSDSFSRSLLGLVGLRLTTLETPLCHGVFDEATRSVWVLEKEYTMLLWRRGFFGKGDLSRSEPSWLSRQINNRRTGNRTGVIVICRKFCEHVILGLTAEEVTAKRRAERKQFKIDRARAIAQVAAEAEEIFKTEGRVVVPTLSGPSIPSGATWKPASMSAESPELVPPPVEDSPAAKEEEAEEEPLEDLEHLQLTLPEAFFLMWNFDCLAIEDPNSVRVFLPPRPPVDLQFDNPFLINYIVYHHYRSLGWVVRGGIKFCVDYMLYKRGPVFNHAEFSVVVCPVYEDPADRDASVVDLHHSTPFSWSWLGTINRVNTQVFKTLILAYVTIPARSRVSPESLNSPACLQYYSVREVIVRRFIPARMRD
ncbi:unnamed protein product [Mycena citricolor]|uniref:tRNA-splicing endonuclease subunit Sen2 n=1 Tax=Mycena citricolor TaxID=2018698 RepID=A0AAD2HGX1_9AGAR|nr:unnamed protein product [Mycena citricolor]